MAEHTHSTPADPLGRRPLTLGFSEGAPNLTIGQVFPLEGEKGALFTRRTSRLPAAAVQTMLDIFCRNLRTPEGRAEAEDLVERLLARLDALDGDPDMEPNADGEAEPDEASLHPVTLAADRVPAVVVRFPRRGGQLGKFAEFLASPASKCKFALCSSGALPPPPAFRPEGGR
ncbi:hypothetical protein LPC08_19205 [Roseomonas sp. OT10]|uniref:hypothetical protein n=1 Tax=Roseomonas cutis TaxID=2897332 RepID=UPI001E283802|nr:hypothetical protein [Roseomonas sp. OT10]UFN48123.1 hypothetical protein LPC08_19205 [Roseomonas sp. OT10]